MVRDQRQFRPTVRRVGKVGSRRTPRLRAWTARRVWRKAASRVEDGTETW